MIGVHASRIAEELALGYVEVRRGDNGWVWMARPEDTCLSPLRDGPCEMDRDHRGRCSTVVFYCDGCGKTRRGQPTGVARDGNGDIDVVFCWLCMRRSS